VLDLLQIGVADPAGFDADEGEQDEERTDGKEDGDRR
jgi:hypothetical protein